MVAQIWEMGLKILQELLASRVAEVQFLDVLHNLGCAVCVVSCGVCLDKSGQAEQYGDYDLSCHCHVSIVFVVSTCRVFLLLL